MKFSTAIVIFSAAAVISAQIDSGPALPKCAESCIEDGLGSSSCDPSDFACQCSDTAALGAVMTCVQSSCDASQIPTIIAAAAAICAEYGGDRLPGILSSAVTSATSSIGSKTSSRTSTVTNTTSKSSGTSTKPASQTSTRTSRNNIPQPTSTGAPNGAGRNAVTGGFGLFVVLAGFVAGL
ncbi:hypothetical protein ABW20_dc0108864 [Dactylellina cionopaga]|nr:hypothetical protein ABW20_dc0108864 [Dactylellina cionopaga]